MPQYKCRWQKSMAEQFKDLLNFEQVEREMLRPLKKFEVNDQ